MFGEEGQSVEKVGTIGMALRAVELLMRKPSMDGTAAPAELSGKERACYESALEFLTRTFKAEGGES